MEPCGSGSDWKVIRRAFLGAFAGALAGASRLRPNARE